MLKMLAGLLVSGLLIVPGSAYAETRGCRLKPTSVITTNGGDLYISGLVQPSGSWQWQRICNVSSPVLDTTVDACKSWASAALTAQATGKILFALYDDGGDPARADCGTFLPWKDAPMRYLGVEG